MTKKEMLDREKPWIGFEAKKLSKDKNKLYSGFLKEKDATKKPTSNQNTKYYATQSQQKLELIRKSTVRTSSKKKLRQPSEYMERY